MDCHVKHSETSVAIESSTDECLGRFLLHWEESQWWY